MNKKKAQIIETSINYFLAHVATDKLVKLLPRSRELMELTCSFWAQNCNPSLEEIELLDELAFEENLPKLKSEILKLAARAKAKELKEIETELGR